MNFVWNCFGEICVLKKSCFYDKSKTKQRNVTCQILRLKKLDYKWVNKNKH